MPTRARNILQFIALMIGYYIVFIPTALILTRYSTGHFIFTEPEHYILDKIAIYVCIYYGSFLVAYGITQMIANLFRLDLSIYLPALTVYLIISAHLFYTKSWPARGMEVNSRKLYFLLLFAPVGIAIGLAALSALKRRLSKSR